MEEEKCLYQTVYSTLQERIRTGKIQPGERLPAEKVLAEEFEVSRITVQKAMSMLVQDGYVVRRPGRGSFATMNANIEYEYLYLDREVSVDKVMAKSRRKKANTFSVDKMEVLAPLNSHRLDSYRNRNAKTLDYSSGVAAQPGRRYMMVCEGDVKVIFEPNAEMVKAIQSIAPRKVFTD